MALLTLAMFQLQGKTIRMICQGDSAQPGPADDAGRVLGKGKAKSLLWTGSRTRSLQDAESPLPAQLLPTMVTAAPADCQGDTGCLSQAGNVTGWEYHTKVTGEQLWGFASAVGRGTQGELRPH